MHSFNKQLTRQKQHEHGRIELKRKRRSLRNILIRLFLAILVFVAISLFFIIYYRIPADIVSTIAALVFGVWFVPSFLPVMFEEMKKTSDDPDRRLHKEGRIREREEKRRTAQAKQAAANAPGEADGQGILGGVYTSTLDWHRGPYATLPANELAKHGIVIGGSGSGKTVSLLRIAYIAAKVYHYRIFYVDAKGDRDTASQFMALMRSLGSAPRMFPRESFDGWRGNGNALLNRLMALEQFSEPYYKAVAKRVLTLICNDKEGAPRSSEDFFGRFTTQLQDSAHLSANEMGGVALRYRAFFGALEGKLDGHWSWEDTNSGYILLDGLSLKEEAASLGRFLVEDFSHYATTRKTPGTKDLLIIDEYSALSQSGADAANLIERLRSYGCAVILSSQSYAGLGRQEDAERMLDAANWLLIHRNAAPERLTRRAGTTEVERDSYQIDRLKSHGTTRTTIGEEDAIHPDEARRLKTGQALLVANGCYMRAMIAQPPAPDAGAVTDIRAWIDQPPSEPLQEEPAQGDPKNSTKEEKSGAFVLDTTEEPTEQGSQEHNSTDQEEPTAQGDQGQNSTDQEESTAQGDPKNSTKEEKSGLLLLDTTEQEQNSTEGEALSSDDTEATTNEGQS